MERYHVRITSGMLWSFSSGSMIEQHENLDMFSNHCEMKGQVLPCHWTFPVQNNWCSRLQTLSSISSSLRGSELEIYHGIRNSAKTTYIEFRSIFSTKIIPTNCEYHSQVLPEFGTKACSKSQNTWLSSYFSIKNTLLLKYSITSTHRAYTQHLQK